MTDPHSSAVTLVWFCVRVLTFSENSNFEDRVVDDDGDVPVRPLRAGPPRTAPVLSPAAKSLMAEQVLPESRR